MGPGVVLLPKKTQNFQLPRLESAVFWSHGGFFKDGANHLLVFALFVSLRERTLVFETVDGRAPRARAPGSQRRVILLFGALRCGQGRAPGMLSAAGGFRLFGLCDAAILSMAFGGISRGGTEAWPGEVRDGSSHRYGRGYRPPAARCACAGKALRGRGADRGSPRTVLGQS